MITSSTQRKTKSFEKCNWCDSKKHEKKSCPARNCDCFVRGKKGHYARVCKSQRGPGVQSIPTNVDNKNQFLGQVVSDNDNKLMITVDVDGEPILCRVYCGADVTVLPKSYLCKFKDKLQSCNSKLFGPQCDLLPVIGKFSALFIVDGEI